VVNAFISFLADQIEPRCEPITDHGVGTIIEEMTGQSMRYSCLLDDIVSSGDLIRNCSYDGWSGTPPQCEGYCDLCPYQDVGLGFFRINIESHLREDLIDSVYGPDEFFAYCANGLETKTEFQRVFQCSSPELNVMVANFCRSAEKPAPVALLHLVNDGVEDLLNPGPITTNVGMNMTPDLGIVTASYSAMTLSHQGSLYLRPSFSFFTFIFLMNGQIIQWEGIG